MRMGILEVHVEGGRISDADPGESYFAAPEFHAALEVRVEDPHSYPPQKALDGASFSRGLTCCSSEMIRARQVGGECDLMIYINRGCDA
jgi:hypothetical protein